MAHGGGDSSPLLQLSVGSFQGVSGAQTQRRAAMDPLEVCGHLQLQRVTTEIGARQRRLGQKGRLSLSPKSA
jgi:hypothetical protein